ncbi:MAG: D-alanyl-D-alanine carboxypeptidase [Pseudobdellovibrionaceae bacterium]
MTGVVSLAGYAGRSDGRVFSFTFIFNGTKDEASVRSFFDQMLIALLK